MTEQAARPARGLYAPVISVTSVTSEPDQDEDEDQPTRDNTDNTDNTGNRGAGEACVGCGQPLLLHVAGRDTCERCRREEDE